MEGLDNKNMFQTMTISNSWQHVSHTSIIFQHPTPKNAPKVVELRTSRWMLMIVIFEGPKCNSITERSNKSTLHIVWQYSLWRVASTVTTLDCKESLIAINHVMLISHKIKSKPLWNFNIFISFWNYLNMSMVSRVQKLHDKHSYLMQIFHFPLKS